MSITLSENAAKEIKSIIKDQDLPEDKTRLRVGVKGGGCSGFSYVLDLVEEEPGEADEIVESQGIQNPLRHEVVPLPPGRRDRPQGRRHDAARLRVQEPERHQQLRLRPLVQRLSDPTTNERLR
ncbi:MAG: iron-sulfur cluster biosynthesis family protein [Tepidisphaeraceae bacterium]